MRTIALQFTHDDALVLFEFLQRFSETEVLSITNKAEERALWNMCCLLERCLAEPFAENYKTLLEEARARLGNE